MEANKITLKTFSVSIAAIVLLEAVFRLPLAERIAASLALLGIIRCFESAVLVIIVLLFEKNIASIGLAFADISSGILKGLLWSACFAMGAAGLYLVLLAVGLDGLQFLQGPGLTSWNHLILLFLVGGMIGPISEEIFFRGIIYGFLRQWGAVPAIILSTLIFVSIHPFGSSLPVTQTIGGIVFAIAYEKERNLMVPITIHCLGNLAIFSLTAVI